MAAELGRIAVVVSTFNRKNLALTFLESLQRSVACAHLDALVVLVDDASSDGTAEAVQSRFPHVRIICGDGTLYWAGAVRLAMREIEQELDALDGFLLANEDVTLADTAVRSLYDLGTERRALVAGTVYSRQDQSVEASGGKFGRLCRPRLQPVEPDGHPQLCDLLPAHCLYIPSVVYRQLGPFDPRFTHGFIDLEYSARAAQAGIPRYLAPRPAGTVEHAHDYQSGIRQLDLSLGELTTWLRYHPKAPPVRETAHYLRSVSPVLWPLWMLPFYRSYLNVGVRALRRAWSSRSVTM